MSDPLSTSDIQSKVAQTRAQLESTLDAIEDKLNVPKQVGFYARKAQERYSENPVPWVAGAAAGIAIAGGLIIWAATSRD